MRWRGGWEEAALLLFVRLAGETSRGRFSRDPQKIGPSRSYEPFFFDLAVAYVVILIEIEGKLKRKNQTMEPLRILLLGIDGQVSRIG
jgi:hypothetical protein